MKKIFTISFLVLSLSFINAQENWDEKIDIKLSEVLFSHREFVSIPNLPSNVQNMYKNIDWVKNKYQKVGFQLKKLPTTTLPVLFAERIIDAALPTVLFYFHIDGQAVNSKMWDQKDPFIPVLKEQKSG